MSFWKWLAEQFTPGPVGSLLSSEQEKAIDTPPSFFQLVVVSVMGLAFLVLFSWLIIQSEDRAGNTIILMIYLGLSFLLSPQPRYDNMGWLGGLINNPFRISDNVNRFIFLLAILLIPGQLIVFGFKALILLLASFKRNQ